MTLRMMFAMWRPTRRWRALKIGLHSDFNLVPRCVGSTGAYADFFGIP